MHAAQMSASSSVGSLIRPQINGPKLRPRPPIRVTTNPELCTTTKFTSCPTGLRVKIVETKKQVFS